MCLPKESTLKVYNNMCTLKKLSLTLQYVKFPTLRMELILRRKHDHLKIIKKLVFH